MFNWNNVKAEIPGDQSAAFKVMYNIGIIPYKTMRLAEYYHGLMLLTSKPFLKKKILLEIKD